MKILSLMNMDPRKLGSFEEYTITLSRHLTASGGESVLVFRKMPPAQLLPIYRDAGAILETMPFDPYAPAAAQAMHALVRRYRPDVVHMHFVSLISLHVLTAGLMPGVKLVFSEHDSDTPRQRPAVKSLALKGARRALSSLVDAAITPSNYVNRRMAATGTSAGKIQTIHNGVNLERFRGTPVSPALLESFGLGPGTMLVGSVSQVIPEKGIGVLIDAAAIVRNAGADIAFFHVGDGRHLKAYREKVSALGLSGRFHFTGLLNLPDIADLLKYSSLFTLPCTWGEAFSLSILEAMAAGKPAIVTSVGGNLEAVEDNRNGILVPPNDANALAAAILKLYRDPALRAAMGAESLRRAGYFSVDRWAEDTIAQYSRILGLADQRLERGQCTAAANRH